MAPGTTARYVVGIDTGGTFTDITVMKQDGEAVINKVPTTPNDFAIGVWNSLVQIAEDLEIPLKDFLRESVVKHGSTVATNALIIRDGARVGLMTTHGFEDTTFVMRGIGRVAGLSEMEMKHQSMARKPDPVVPKERVCGVVERVDYAGRVLVPLNEELARRSIRYLVEEQQVEAIAVSLLWSFANPVHELRIRQLIEEMYGDGVYLKVSSELCPVIREYARCNTVILDCFLGHNVRGYTQRLLEHMGAEGYENPLFIMQANGGVSMPEEMQPIGTLGSGPSGGIIAAKYIGDHLGHRQIITTDMGGTSFDVGLIVDGYWRLDREPVVERMHITWPMIDIKSIGAGGGTIAWIDPVTKQLRLGPKSAGADPGPVCYDMGGTEPTVTDANIVLGYLDPDYFLGGRIRLNREKAFKAIEERIARQLGMGTVEAAAGIYDLVNGHMSDLIRKQVVTTGHIPEEFVIYAFGGAGPVHAAAYGASLGARKTYIFPTSAVFSSFGIASADLMHTLTASERLIMPVDAAELNRRMTELEEKLYRVAEHEGVQRSDVQFRRTLLMRYRRQLNELDLQVPTRTYTEADIQEIVAAFERRYEDVYGEGSGYHEAGVELISISMDLIGPTQKPVLRRFPLTGEKPDKKALKGMRQAYFSKVHDFLDTPVWDYERLKPGNSVTGPAVIETPITTVVIPPGYHARVDDFRNIAIEEGSE